MRRNAAAVFLLFLVFLSCCLLYGRIIIEGDGLTYYALARSLVEDGDFELRNQRVQIPELHLFVSPVTHKIASRFSCGFGILYAPFLIATNALGQFFPSLANWKPYPQNEIVPFSHSLGVFIGSSVFGLCTLFCCLFVIFQKQQVSRSIALTLVLLTFLGTPLLFYTVTMPSYAHAADAFLAAVAFCLAVSPQTMLFKGLRFRNILLGLTLGFAILLRNNNVVLVPPMVLGLLLRERQEPLRRWFSACMELFLGALPPLLVLAYFNISQYGGLLATGYRVQTETGFLVEMLIHPDAGMFLWTPVILLGALGLLIGAIKRHAESMIALSCVLLVLLSIQFQPNWWGGCSFGPRFFTHLYVFWVWGLLEFAATGRKKVVALACVLAAWNFFLFHVFFINAASSEFRIMLRTNKCRRTPVQMIQSASREYFAAKAKGETSSPFSFWLQSLGKGRYPTIQHILLHPGWNADEPETGALEKMSD